MKTPSLKTHGVAAFSMVEVTLALAIVAVGLIAILGLFPQALTSARNAADDSLVAMIAQDAIAERRIEIQIAGTAPIANTTRWFTPDGKVTNAAAASAAMYKCVITGKSVTGVPNLEETQLMIMWPWFTTDTATKSPPNTNTFITQIAYY